MTESPRGDESARHSFRVPLHLSREQYLSMLQVFTCKRLGYLLGLFPGFTEL